MPMGSVFGVNAVIALALSALASYYLADTLSLIRVFLTSCCVLLVMSGIHVLLVRASLHRQLKTLCQTLAALSENRNRHMFTPDDTPKMSSAIEFHFRQMLEENHQLSTEIHEMQIIYNSILNTQEELVFIIDTDGYISYRNKAFDELFGAPSLDFDKESSVFSENLISLMQDISPFINDEDASKKHKQLHFEIEVDGKPRHIIWAINQISHIEPMKTLFVGRDDTEELEIRTRNEKLQKISTVGRAASTIFHEINQPLSVMHISTFMIKNALESVDSHILPEIRQELFHNANVIESQVNRANQIVNNLRLFHSGDRKKLIYEPIQLGNLIRETFSIIDKELRLNDIELIEDLKDADQITITGNRTLFAQVLVNVLKNAIQALESDQGASAPKISVTTQILEHCVAIAIEDNGPGMLEAELTKATEPFYSTKDEGSGLGLALCLDILNSYRGNLELENVAPRGLRAIISFSLPTNSPLPH